MGLPAARRRANLCGRAAHVDGAGSRRSLVLRLSGVFRMATWRRPDSLAYLRADWTQFLSTHNIRERTVALPRPTHRLFEIPVLQASGSFRRDVGNRRRAAPSRRPSENIGTESRNHPVGSRGAVGEDLITDQRKLRMMRHVRRRLQQRRGSLQAGEVKSKTACSSLDRLVGKIH